MSIELAEKLDIDSASKEVRDRLERTTNRSSESNLSREELDEQIEAIRNGEYVSQKVQSWEELWKREK